MPLYSFARDQAPGGADGEGIKDVRTWNAVTPNAGAGEASAAPSGASSTSSQTGEGGGAHGY